MNANEMLASINLKLGSCSKSYVRLAWKLANDEGTIQAENMLELTNEPRHHTTSKLRQVLLRAGCEEAE